MRNIKPKIFALFVSAGLLLMSAVGILLNPKLLTDAWASTNQAWQVPCIADTGPCPGPQSGVVKVCNESTLTSNSANCLVVQDDVKTYVDALETHIENGFTLTGALAGFSTSEISMASGSSVNLSCDVDFLNSSTTDIESGADWNFAGKQDYLSGATTGFESGSTTTFDSGSNLNIAGSLQHLSGATVDYKAGSTTDLEANSHFNFAGDVAFRSGATTEFLSGSTTVCRAGSLWSQYGVVTHFSGATDNWQSGAVIDHNTGVTATYGGSYTYQSGATVNLDAGAVVDADTGVLVTFGGSITYASGATVTHASGSTETYADGSQITVNGLLELQDGITVMIGNTWQMTIPGWTASLVGEVYTDTVTDGHTLIAGATVVSAYTIRQGSFPAGAALFGTCAGTKAGAIAAFDIEVHIDGTKEIELTTIATVAGDWKMDFTLINSIAGAAENKIAATLALDNDTEVIADYDETSVADFTAGDVAIEVFVESKNGADTVTLEFCTFWRND